MENKIKINLAEASTQSHWKLVPIIDEEIKNTINLIKGDEFEGVLSTEALLDQQKKAVKLLKTLVKIQMERKGADYSQEVKKYKAQKTQRKLDKKSNEVSICDKVL